MADFYDPVPVIQLDGSQCGGSNCTCAVAATQLDRVTGGKQTTTGAAVRRVSGVPCPAGHTLTQIAYAMHQGWGIQLNIQRDLAFADAVDRVAAGQCAIVDGGYTVFHTYKLAGAAFYGNHAILWLEVKVVLDAHGHLDLDASQAYIWDPLWDGRRPGIPSKQLRWVTLRLVYDFAAAYSLNGLHGRIWLAFGPATAPLKPIPAPHPAINILYGANSMIVAGGLVLTSNMRMQLKAGEPIHKTADPNGPVVTHMSKAVSVYYMGNAGNGMKAVVVATGNFADHLVRPIIGYVPATAGPIVQA